MWFQDIKGQRFGRMLALEYLRAPTCKWRCVCDCGSERFLTVTALTSGNTRSCGCLKREVTGNRWRKHGERNAPVYEVWIAMRDRCNNPRNKAYANYGGRGIKCCPEWSDYLTFKRDMGPRPEGCSLDRIDNNKGYERENCRWATSAQQSSNLRRSVYLEHDGKRLIAREWSTLVGIPAAVIYGRVHYHGWSAARALTTPVRQRG